MTAKESFVLSLHKAAIYIYSVPEYSAGSLTGMNNVSRLRLTKDVYDGQFALDMEEGPISAASDVFARIFLYSRSGDIQQAIVTCETDRNGLSFTLHESFNNDSPRLCIPYYLHHYSIGPISQRVLYLKWCEDPHNGLPIVATARIRTNLTYGTDRLFLSFTDDTCVNRDGLPLPHFINCIDFDDSRGILLIGTITGEVRVAFFTETQVITRSSLAGDIPEDTFGDSILGNSSGTDQVWETLFGCPLILSEIILDQCQNRFTTVLSNTESVQHLGRAT